MTIPESYDEDEIRKILAQSSLDTPKVQLALAQAVQSHKNQTREDGEPYLNEHVFPVTALVITFFKDKVSEEVVAGALLHDCLEDDPDFTEEQLEKTFGSTISQIVKLLSKPAVEGDLSETEKRRLVNAAYFEKLSTAPYETKVIKLLDRIDNLYWAMTFGKELVQIYLDETRNFYLPFAKSTNQELYATILELTNHLEEQAKKADFI